MSGGECTFWDALPGYLLHETQLWIIEALLWIGGPLSASQLTKAFDGEDVNLSGVSYHFRRLSDLGVLELVGERQTRGVVEKLYLLSSPRTVRPS